MGKLSSADADFLDAMIAHTDKVRELATEFVRSSDETSNQGVVDMARSVLESTEYQSEHLREVRGHADGDQLRHQDVEVEAAY